MTAALDVSDAKVWFGGVKAVDGVSLSVDAGRLHGVIGPNGSGKTTLLNAISGVQPLTAGRIEIGGRDTTRLRAHAVSRAGVARTFQSIRLLPTLSVRENVQLGADHHVPGRGAGRAARIAELADSALERLDIAHLAQRSPAELSYGTRRRVEIARGLAAEPTVLLLDEPLAGMNRAEREDIASLLGTLRDDGITQIIIEHDLRTLLGLCDHLFVMNFGKLVAEGPPRETAESDAVQEIYLGRRHGAA
jgi:branched-chain amino acid transport system ATP-binding protein